MLKWRLLYTKGGVPTVRAAIDPDEPVLNWGLLYTEGPVPAVRAARDPDELMLERGLLYTEGPVPAVSAANDPDVPVHKCGLLCRPMARWPLARRLARAAPCPMDGGCALGARCASRVVAPARPAS